MCLPKTSCIMGLEYKYLTLCCLGQLTREEMLRQLEIAIHQFAKRQMTWFRGMERRGTPIIGRMPVRVWRVGQNA